MKAVLVEVPGSYLAERRRRGLDRRDEMWEGVLHIVPTPSNERQRIHDDLIVYLCPWLRETGRGVLRSGINVFARDDDYRIPDLTYVAYGRERVLAADGVRGGPPDSVIEIRSPEDETYEKLPFFARLGVREVVVIDRDSKRPDIFRLVGQQYVAVAADRDGWLTSETLSIRLRAEQRKLVLEDPADPARRATI